MHKRKCRTRIKHAGGAKKHLLVLTHRRGGSLSPLILTETHHSPIHTYRWCWYTHKCVLEDAQPKYSLFPCDDSARRGGKHSPSAGAVGAQCTCYSFAFLAYIIPIFHWKLSHYAYFTFPKCIRPIHRITGSVNNFVLAFGGESEKPTHVLKKYTRLGWNFFYSGYWSPCSPRASFEYCNMICWEIHVTVCRSSCTSTSTSTTT